ncbi:MAG: FAD-binding protein [Deltaproteobacteria bacterium]|nr:MAG: FAD-binding protein [Deltaproteobacteria bacterium]
MPSPTRRELLLGAGALALGLGPVAHAEPWTNQAGNVTFDPRQRLAPSTVDEVAAAVKAAKKVKAVGGGHSFHRGTETEGTLISVENLRAQRALDGDAVWLEAGLTLREASELLAAQGRALPSLPSGGDQTLGGAVSTATHGGNPTCGSLSDGDSLLALELVDAAGAVRTLEVEDDTLAAARVGLGALGVITAVKLRTVPTTALRLKRGLVSEWDGLNPERIAQHDHYSLFWLPLSERFVAVTRDETTAEAHHGNVLRKDWRACGLEPRALGKLLRKAAGDAEASERALARMAGAVESFEAVGPDHEIQLTTGSLSAIEAAWALPRESAEDGLRAIRELTEAWARDGRFFLNLPVEMRWVRGDRGTLISPTQGRDSVVFGLASHPDFVRWPDFFAAVGKSLGALGARAHWGKHGASPRNHPEWERFAAVREAMDPGGKFLNPWLEGLLG